MTAKLKLVKNWGYDVNPDETSDANDGFIALAKINRLKGECTSRKSSDETLANKYDTWAHCLEEHGNVWGEKMHSLLYAHAGNLTANIADFINQIETLLDIHPRTKLYLTTRTTISAVRVSPWWVDSEDGKMKRALFGILLRWGRNHVVGGDIFETMNKSKYGPQLMNFMRLFLDGYTKFSEASVRTLQSEMHSGPFTQFGNKTEDEIKLNLYKET